MRSTCLSNELLNPIPINLAVIGLSGTSQVKGVSGIGKSSICNRLVRPLQYNKQISTLTSVDFYSDIINGTHWIYWDHVVRTVESRSYAFHIIEQTILINDQTYAPFGNYTESEYISRAISGRIAGSKRAYICPSQFSSTQSHEASLINDDVTIDAFLVVYDVSEVNSRDYLAQDRCTVELLNALYKIKKPLIVVASKADAVSSKIRSRLDSILEKRNFRSLPLVETSAKLNINIAAILTVVGSLLNSGQKAISFTPLKQLAIKPDSFDVAFSKQRQVAEEYRVRLDKLVSSAVNRNNDILWSQFWEETDFTEFLSIFDRMELQKLFEEAKSKEIRKINEDIIDMYGVLFKELVYRFVDSMLTEDSCNDRNITNRLLNSSEFLGFFQDIELSEKELMNTVKLSPKIDYPLPKFFITTDHPLSKLNIIDVCVDEIRFQKVLSNFSEEFLRKLEANINQSLSLSFTDIERQFKDEENWSDFRITAKLIFDEFVKRSTKIFKEAFDEKLLELSFMIYSIEPMRNSIHRDSKKKKLFDENLVDMSHINSIDKQIYFDNNCFKKGLCKTERTKWIVKYIGALLSSNPNQCYIFDFNPEACCKHLTNYLKPISCYIENLVVVISGDKKVDDIWRESITISDPNLVFQNGAHPANIQFFSSTIVETSSFWENRFSTCQKVVFVFSDDSANVNNSLNRLLSEEIVNNTQLSVINLAKNSATFNNNLVCELVKKWNINYSNIGWSLCLGQNLIKLINEQSNSYLSNAEPLIIWMVVLCADTYDSDIPLSFVLSIFQDYIITDKNIDNDILSISLFYIPPNTSLPHKLNISIVSYHQALKWITEDNLSTNPHLLLYFCNLCRLASINTMFAVMQNIYSSYRIKSIMCAIACVSNQDPVEIMEKKSMLDRLAGDRNSEYILLEDNEELYELNLQKLSIIINSCAIQAGDIDENKNLCCYNNAFENDDVQNVSRLKMYDDNSNVVQHKDFGKYREYRSKEFMCESKPIFNYSNFLSRSNSQYSSDIPFYDAFIQPDKNFKWVDLHCNEFCDSVPLGCCNEDLFQPIKEEFTFHEANITEDKNTIVHVNCQNIEHIRETSLERNRFTNNSKTRPTPKMRSYSGPVPTNKSFSRKLSGSQNSANRCQRFTKKSQSLTTSPLTSTFKPLPLCENGKSQGDNCRCCNSPQGNTNEISTSTSKSFKSIFSRLFSSERYDKKSADEKRSIFRRSFKFPKRNSERKTKTIPLKSGTDLPPTTTPPDSGCLPISHSTSQSLLDPRKKSKFILPLKNL